MGIGPALRVVASMSREDWAVKLLEHIQAMPMIICPVGLILAVVLIHLCIQAAVWVVDTYLAVARDLITKL
jgi:hypothetical protein